MAQINIKDAIINVVEKYLTSFGKSLITKFYTKDSVDGKIDTIDGNVDDIKEETIEIDTHIHSYETWFETAASPSGETHIADEIGFGGGSFQLDADNDDWGSWVQLLGSSDTPHVAGKVAFDLHRVEVESTERDETYFIQISVGDSGDAGVSAGNYTDIVFTPLSNQLDGGPNELQMAKVTSGNKVWARCKCPGQNTALFNFYFGIHEYNA